MCAAFQATVEARRNEVALRTRGGLVELTWGEYDARVRRAAAALHRLGLRRGDTLALMLANRPEFHIADAAAMHLGAIPFSIDDTAAPEQVGFVVKDSRARIAVVEERWTEFVDAEHVLTPEQLATLPTDELDFDASWQGARAEDPLTLIYGDGAQLTHRNVLFSVASYAALLHLRRGRPVAATDARVWSHYLPMWLGSPVTCDDGPDVLADARPSWIFGDASLYVELRAALESGASRRELGLDDVSGLSVRSPCPPEVIEFFHELGLPLGELWGISETTAIGACNPPSAIRIGTVGPPVPGVNLRIAGDGEILVNGPCVFAGYRNRPDLTRETFTADGWLLTGDVGELDDHGYLRIVGRKHELIISAAGQSMSPASIESRIRDACPAIGSAVVIGDRRPYNVALIVPAPGADREQIPGAIEAANGRLSASEQIKRYTVLDTEWQPGGDELTPASALRRRPIEAKYAAEIDALYEA